MTGKTKPVPVPKPVPPDVNLELFNKLLTLIAHQVGSLSIVDFTEDWLTEEVIKIVPEGEEIITSLIKEMVNYENHDGLCPMLKLLNEYGSWLDDMRPAPRKELLDILTSVAQHFWENKVLVTIISDTFAQVPNEAIDAMREAEIDNDSFDEIVKKMFAHIQGDC